MSERRVVRIALAGFSLLVGLVLLAAYLGYRGSDRIQNTAQSLVREQVPNSARAARLEASLLQQTQEFLDELAWVLALCFLLALGTAGMTMWIIQRAFAQLQWQATELAHVSWHMIDGHEKMARRFSHEMHDELGQSLSGLRRLLGRVRADEFEGMRQESLEIVDEVLQNVRKLSQVLRPVILDDFGLDSGLRWLCERFVQRTQINVEYESTFSGRLAESLETHLFRITQEALTNIARHSGATEAWVRLTTSQQSISLSIEDNGRGLQPATQKQNPSLGMVGMRARVRQVGGELKVENRKGGGLMIHVLAPLRANESNIEQSDTHFVG